MITTFYALKLPHLMEYNKNYSYLLETLFLVSWGIVIGSINHYNNKLSLISSISLIMVVGYYGVINNLYWIALFTTNW
jgi:hypothetical protein